VRKLIAHCISVIANRSLNSRFSLAKLDEQALARIFADHRDLEDLYPLTPMQQGLLAHSLYAAGSGAYVEQLICTLGGDLDTSALNRAWRQVIGDHPILRTSFFWRGLDNPVQIVHRNAELPVEHRDWQDLDGRRQREELALLLDSDRYAEFNLSEAPLLRLYIIQTSKRSYYLVLSFHHLALDGWSLSAVIDKVFSCYEAFCCGRQVNLESSRAYRDYIAWLQERDLSFAASFWREELRGFSSPVQLLFDRGAGSSFKQKAAWQQQQIELSDEQTYALKLAARNRGLTLSTVVQGAWALLLSRYSAREDVVFGVIASGRTADLEGVESMVGLLINTLPVRVQVDPGNRLTDWLDRLQSRQLDARQYEFSPLAQIHQWSELPPHQPLFETILVFENYPLKAALGREFAGMIFEQVDFIGARTNYPLAILVFPEDHLSVLAVHDPHRFDAGDIEKMLRDLCSLLTGIAGDPEQTVASLATSIRIEPASEAAAVESRPDQVFAMPGYSWPPASNASPAQALSPVEKSVAAIFAEVLALDAVGVDDNLFALGGDSLKATQVIIRAQEIFQVELSLDRFVRAPTVMALTIAILESQAGDAQSQDEVFAELDQLSEDEARRILADLQGYVN
jgi:acyl carrier protein